ncbi:MAG: FMN-binding protein, partial [Firmicutes bacterium]|nr:FMN-binding protein [Bacillota bacterium]
MGNSKFKEYFAPTVVLLVICLVASALLTGTYIMTKPIIAQREADAASGALAVVLPGGSDFAVMEDVTLVENVLEVQKAGNGEGFVVTASVGGYGGQVQSMVGINSAGEITGLQVMNHAETAGLGTKAFEEAYLSQFWGATSTDGADVIGGATYSSKAIIGAIDATILQYEVANGASYEAPVQLTPEEQFAADCLEVLPGADAFTKLEGVTLA